MEQFMDRLANQFVGYELRHRSFKEGDFGLMT